MRVLSTQPLALPFMPISPLSSPLLDFTFSSAYCTPLATPLFAFYLVLRPLDPPGSHCRLVAGHRLQHGAPVDAIVGLGQIVNPLTGLEVGGGQEVARWVEVSCGSGTCAMQEP